MAECAVYLARAKKSHEVYGAMNACNQMLSEPPKGGVTPGVPLHLRNASSKLGKDLGYGQGYSYDLAKVKSIQYMPDELKDVNFFRNF